MIITCIAFLSGQLVNFFHPCLVLGVSGPLASKDWYYGAIKRQECDEMLNHYGTDGDFVIRDSETNAGDYSVSLKAPGFLIFIFVSVVQVNFVKYI